MNPSAPVTKQVVPRTSPSRSVSSSIIPLPPRAQLPLLWIARFYSHLLGKLTEHMSKPTLESSSSSTGPGVPALTVFATMKHFRGRAAVHQRNAIRSWTLLRPRPEVILFGDEDGVVQICE